MTLTSLLGIRLNYRSLNSSSKSLVMWNKLIHLVFITDSPLNISWGDSCSCELREKESGDSGVMSAPRNACKLRGADGVGIPEDLSILTPDAVLDFYGTWTQLSRVFPFLCWDLHLSGSARSRHIGVPLHTIEPILLAVCNFSTEAACLAPYTSVLKPSAAL